MAEGPLQLPANLAPFRLPGRPLIRTSWLDELGKAVALETDRRSFSYCPGTRRDPSEITVLPLGRTRFYGVNHGGAVRCSTAKLACYEVIFVSDGELLSGPDSATQQFHRGEAAIHIPGVAHNVRWSAGSKAVILRIDPACFATYADLGAAHVAVLGGSIIRVATNSGLGGSLYGLCAQIWSETPSGRAVADLPAQEDLLLHAVALIVERQQGVHVRRAMPPYLKRTVDFILDNLTGDLRASTLMRVAGVSGRTLQQAFTRSFGIGPLAFARRARMERIRAALERAQPWETTVTTIATQWGCTHLSNFSRRYRLAFGELPSDTLRRRNG